MKRGHEKVMEEFDEEREEATNQVLDVLEEWEPNQNSFGLENYIESLMSIKGY